MTHRHEYINRRQSVDMKNSERRAQRGGFLIGLIVGLLIGLSAALGVALYVTKAPNPFINKVPQRSAVQDAAEAERNRNWDPNAALAGKNPARPSANTVPASAVVTTPEAIPLPPVAAPPVSAGASVPAPTAAARPAKTASAAGERPPVVVSNRASAPLSTGTAGDPFTYFVQAGAYAHTEDAEQQRAKLAMLGIDSRMTEREQAGRTVYRIRVGPFENKSDADAAKEKLNDAGIDSALVRVQR
jgi:cell division protein FtsN